MEEGVSHDFGLLERVKSGLWWASKEEEGVISVGWMKFFEVVLVVE